jgi:protease-4
MSEEGKPSQQIYRQWLYALLPVFIGLMALVGGWLLANQLVPQPAVGIIRLEFDIWSLSADFVKAQIDEALEDKTIKAIVVRLDSPGGSVAPTQAIYLELLKLRQVMPVVSSIESMAASGGYYVAVATDPIFAKPSSVVGNVGVWGYVPPDIGVNEVVLASGPFKLTASNQEEFLREIEAIKQEFLQTVAAGRGDRLEISLVDLSQGLAYHGREALNLGLIDHLGSQTEAIESAAKLAGIAHYRVVDLAERVVERLLGEQEVSQLSEWVGAADPVTGRRTLPAGIYLLYDIRLGSGR